MTQRDQGGSLTIPDLGGRDKRKAGSGTPCPAGRGSGAIAVVLTAGFLLLLSLSASIPAVAHAADCLQEAVVWRPWQAVGQPLVREAPARVEPLEVAKVASDVAGRLVRVPVRVGEWVAAGAVVAELDATALRLARREAEAAGAAAQTKVAQAKRLLAQAERLARERASNEEAVRAAHEAVRLAEAEAELRAAQLAQAEWRLAQTTVRAPFAGVVTARLAAEGSWVAAGQGLVTLVPDRQEVAVRVPRAQAAELRDPAARPTLVLPEGAEVPLTWMAENGEVEAAAQLLLVRLRSAEERALTPGAVGVVRWYAPVQVVPPAIVSAFADRPGLWVRQRGTEPQFVPLATALPGRAAVAVLPPGWTAEATEVAVAGQGQLAWRRVAADADKECRP